MWCPPIPWLYLWLLAALTPACLSYIEEPRSRFIIQTWQRAKITTFSLLVMLFQCSPGWHWPSLLQVYVAGSCSTWCWPMLTILSCFYAKLLSSWLAPWDYSPCARLGMSLCWLFSGLQERPISKHVLKSFRERIALVTGPHPFPFTAQGLCTEKRRESWTVQELLWPMESSEGT